MPAQTVKMFTQAGDIARLERWIEQLPVNGRVRITKEDGIVVEGIVAVTPALQIVRDEDDNEGTNGVVKLERDDRPEWSETVWLGDIRDVTPLDSVRKGVSKA